MDNSSIVTLLLLFAILFLANSPLSAQYYLGGQVGTLWTDGSDQPSSAGYGGGYLFSVQKPKYYIQSGGGYSYMWSSASRVDAFHIYAGGGATFDWANIGGDIGLLEFDEAAITIGLSAHGKFDFSEEVRFVGGVRSGILVREFTTGYGAVYFALQLNLH